MIRPLRSLFLFCLLTRALTLAFPTAMLSVLGKLGCGCIHRGTVQQPLNKISWRFLACTRTRCCRTDDLQGSDSIDSRSKSQAVMGAGIY